jgi:hypothetical protein
LPAAARIADAECQLESAMHGAVKARDRAGSSVKMLARVFTHFRVLDELATAVGVSHRRPGAAPWVLFRLDGTVSGNRPLVRIFVMLLRLRYRHKGFRLP